jgi:phytoene dehydrogenase-like protein
VDLKAPKKAKSTGFSIAVIGGGPGGLSAAWQLGLKGHSVDLYEAGSKIGGKLPGQGPGVGSHWHVATKVLYYSTDMEDQVIPYIRVYNADGTYTEYTDLQANVDPKQTALLW